MKIPALRIVVPVLAGIAIASAFALRSGGGSIGSAVRIGVNHSPPYSEIGPDGIPHGFTVDVLTEAARRGGINLEWVAANEGPDAALASGRVDVWALMAKTPAREGHNFFSDPYLRTRFALLIPRDGPIRGRADAPGRRISHGSAVFTSQIANQFFPRSTLIRTQQGEEMEAVCQGVSDAAFIEIKAMLRSLLTRPADCRSMTFEILAIEGANFDMAVGSNRAGRKVASALRSQITELSRDGTLDGLFREWLRDTTDETRIVGELREANERSRLLFWGVALLGTTLSLLLWMMHRRRMAQKAIKSAYDFASVALDSAGGLVLICDRRGQILRFNRACERASGKTLHEVRGKTTWEILVPTEERAVVQSLFGQLGAGTGHANHEHHWQSADGPRLYSWSNTTLTNQNGRIDYIIATGIDITAREEAEERLGYEARHDPLTSLANRRHFLSELDIATATSLKGSPGFSLAFADLDEFKLINDTYGHAAGDEVLVYFARVLREELAPEDLAGRLGGDEFCLLLRSPFFRNRIERIRRRLVEHVFRSQAGLVFHASVSVGLASWSASMRQASEILGAADEALYRAKRERCNPVPRFDPEHPDKAGILNLTRETAPRRPS